MLRLRTIQTLQSVLHLGPLKAEPKECLTGKGQVLSKGLRAERIKQMANFNIIANKDCLKSTIVYARFI